MIMMMMMPRAAKGNSVSTLFLREEEAVTTL
jgi:hypothetical protein